MIEMKQHNPVADLAIDYINHTDRNIFLTGKAGTGKTTFLKSLKTRVNKNFVVLAPTGVAAINAGGVTIHSFFQLPFTPFLPTPEGRKFLLKENRMSKRQKEIMQHLDLIVIDEVSMVRCDILDAMDTLLRRAGKKKDQPFGGVQLLCIGDLYQLPPVVISEEKEILFQYYDTPYFFSSKALQADKPLIFEFTHVYRQSDPHFVDILNQVRENRLTPQALDSLNNRWDREFSMEKYPNCVVLCTHNYQADRINHAQMEKLSEEPNEYRANIQGQFPINQYPCEEVLTLKKGAKIMFVRNDTQIPKRYYNGKIGEVENLNEDTLYIKDENDDMIALNRDKWENIRYNLDENGVLKTEVLGSFEQYPVRLAWAVTIHKSQGLTFDHLAIDAADAFDSGQTYVALSRCKSLKGLVLANPIAQQAVITDQRVEQYYGSQNTFDQLSEAFETEKHHFEHRILTDMYDFSEEEYLNEKLHEFGLQHNGEFAKNLQKWTLSIQTILHPLVITGAKFAQLLPKILSEGGISYRQQRLTDAIAFFIPKIEEILEIINKHNLKTDNKDYAKKIQNDVVGIYNGLNLKKIQIIENGHEFSIARYLSLKNSYKRIENITFYGAQSTEFADVAYKDLYKELLFVRSELSMQHKVPIYMVATTSSLQQMADCLPETMDELRLIKGFGEKKTQKYGQYFIEVIALFREENPDASPQNTAWWKWTSNNTKKGKSAISSTRKKNNTKEITKQLFDEGKTIQEISTLRQLTTETIVNHLIHFMENKEISIERLITKEKKNHIMKIIQSMKHPTRKTVKENADENISYTDIHIVFSWWQQQK